MGRNIHKENFQQKRRGDIAEMLTEAGSASVAPADGGNGGLPELGCVGAQDLEKEGSGTTCLTKFK